MNMNHFVRRSLSGRSFATLILFSALLLLGCRDSTAAGGAAGTAEGASVGAAPEFRLKTLDGRVLGPKDFKGKVVVVDFWATWCGPCQIQSRILEPLSRDYKGKNVQFLAANVGEDERTVRSFLESKPFPYPVLLDADSAVSNSLGVYALPTLMIIDKKGKISFVQPGLTDADTLRQKLKEAGA
jgi:thiol-disulfide isomerase/thioredoxin